MLIPGMKPFAADSSLLPVALRASSARSTLNTPPEPATSWGDGVTTNNAIAGLWDEA